ncbi:MAG: SDR family NAD(P)-dependent oxidoreductase [Gammaproteobacteria bacterium]|jgi:3-oxoacyl-[acyl-carrier protein] reductase|nr:SDR family NAD(P)-dependent oxidoreductase [Gammaproteobacteria bacterium]
MSKEVLVIGGSGDIGSSIATLFSDNCIVKSTSRDELDLSSDKSIKSFLSLNKKKFDHVIFCAASNNLCSFKDANYSEIEQSIKVNLLSITEILHELIKRNFINTEGSIVIISSLYAHFGRTKRFPYSVSKHALLGLVKNLAIELSPKKIRINSVSPGFINTKLTRKNLSSEEIKKIEEYIPSGSIGNPIDIANVVYFLCNKSSNYINGQDIVVDGGFSCGGFMGVE